MAMFDNELAMLEPDSGVFTKQRDLDDSEPDDGVFVQPEAKSVKHLPGTHDQSRHGGASNVGRLASSLREDAIKAEPAITADLQGVAKSVGGTMEGLDFRIKGQASLERKIAADFRENRNLPNAAAAADKITDVLRYTMTLPTAGYSRGVGNALTALKEQGYTLYDTKARNYWTMGVDYRGINMALVKGKQKFELQFHTKDSYETKEVKNHKVYERARETRSSRERKSLIATMASNWASVAVPARVASLALAL